MTPLRYIGGTHPRPDAADKATGRTAYIHDLTRPGLLHGAIRFSDHAHARLVRIDTRRAAALPGVRAVLTAANTPELRLGFLRDNRALKGDKVRQFRDEIAAVAAVDADTAAAAAALIEVEYEPLPAVFDPEAALAPGAPLIHETDARGRPQTDNLVPLTFAHRSGDLDAARRRAVHLVEGVYTTPRIQQSCMGTAGCLAEFDAHDHLTITCKTQIPFLAQRDFQAALAALGLGDRNVRVVVPALGGGFGTGLDTHVYEYLAILLAHRTRRPVKIVYSREQEFAYLSPRQSCTVRIAQGLDGDGRLCLREVDVLQDNGAYASWGATYPSIMLLPATSLYRVGAVRFDCRIVYTNNTYCQAMRGYGNPELTWALERNLEDLAHVAGRDPLELRLAHCNEPGDVTPMGLRLSTCGLRECFTRAAAALGEGQGARGKGQASGFGLQAKPALSEVEGDQARAAPTLKPEAWSLKPEDAPTPRRGIGFAALIHVGGGGKIYRSDGSGVILKFDDFGHVHVSSGAVEMGQGLHSALALTVAEALGVPPAHVHVNQTDTATCPWDVGTHASRGAYMACHAALLACEKARARLFAAAAELYPELVAAALAEGHGAASGFGLRASDQEGACSTTKPEARSLKPEARSLKPEGDPPSFDLAVAARARDFELIAGGLRARGAPDEPAYSVELGRLLRAMHFRDHAEVLTVEAFYEPKTERPDWTRGVGHLSENYAFGVQGAEVEVDEETGEIRVLRLVAVHDVGRVLNRQTLAGQTYGALAQGLGYALYEQVLSAEGRILNPNFTDYKIPTAAELDLPITIDFVETNDARGPFGAKGVGEPGLVPTAPAIANAVFHAVGIRLHDLPMTPERVLAALAARDEAAGTV